MVTNFGNFDSKLAMIGFV